jgi:CheY-like chemotaxis protein
VHFRSSRLAVNGSRPLYAQEKKLNQQENSFQRAAPYSDKSQVLVVEDEVRIRSSLVDALRGADFLVIEAANAEDALKILRSGIAVDVVVSDIRMPGTIDGSELANIVRKEFFNTKIVLVSGYLPKDRSLSVDGFFLKPFHPDSLIRHLKVLIAERASTT